MYRTKARLTHLPRGEFSCLTFTLYNQQQLRPSVSVFYNPPSPAYEVASGPPLLGEEQRVILLLCSGMQQSRSCHSLLLRRQPRKKHATRWERGEEQIPKSAGQTLLSLLYRESSQRHAGTEWNLFYFWLRYLWWGFFVCFNVQIENNNNGLFSYLFSNCPNSPIDCLFQVKMLQKIVWLFFFLPLVYFHF